MSIKDLFGKRSNKVVSKAQAEKLLDEVESSAQIEATRIRNNKLVTRIDYSTPDKFARYGSAEKYYEDSFNHIYNTYPYDGSAAEKEAWNNEASGLDEYILANEYPTAVGHVVLNLTDGTGYDATYKESGAGTYFRYREPQYIKIKGGPNKDPSVEEGQDYELSKQFPAKGGRANIWDDGLYQESNLGIKPASGNTIEFWGKFVDAAWVGNKQAVCLFDLWNGEPHSSANYVRLIIEVLPDSGNDFSVTYKYGNAAEGVERAAVNVTAATKAALGSSWRESWQHYSFAISNTDAGISVELYVNGVYETTVVSGNKITSTLPQEGYIANINALRTKPLSSSPSALKNGDGGCPRFYLDEFRFWKSTRNGKQVGRNWFTAVNGGTNTDTNKYHKETGDMVDLGVYYKFNEGIYNLITVTPQDSQCLDYSGRISNGDIVNYTQGVRIATSAMDASTKVADLGVTEKKDPIMYSTHPDVTSKMTELMLNGNVWDMENNAAFYHTMPNWILEEDQDGKVIKQLAQTLSSYFDTLHSQIETLTHVRDNTYLDLSDTQNQPFFFAKQLLRSTGFDVTDIFSEATILEEIVSRGEQDIFDSKIQEIKNVIYQNIYNNISYIYKSKGTEKSFRNLIRCFGVDDELIKLNLYADGVDYTLDGRFSYTAIKKNYVDFNHPDRQESCVYVRDHSPSSGDERAYIGIDSASGALSAAQVEHLSVTLTAEVIFPKQLDVEHPAFTGKDFTTMSLFGIKEANMGGGDIYNDTGLGNIGRFQVQAIRPERDSLHAKFKLIYTDADGNHELVSDEYKEIYDNTKWNFAVRLTPVDAELGDFVETTTPSSHITYKLEFYGVQMSLDVVEREFTKTATYSNANISKARAMIQTPKIVYCGHYRSNFGDVGTGGAKTDVKITDVMYWFDYLTDDEIKNHGKDASNSGRMYPNDDAYAFFKELSSGTVTDIRVPRKDTLALHWDFTNVTTSDSISQFVVNDISGGGSSYDGGARYGWFTDLVGWRHQGMGSFNPAAPNDNQVVNREYQYTAKQRHPEILAGDDMVEIRTQDDDLFTKDSRPINHFWAIEKSMYQVISDEMLNLFASIVEFNDLIGQPVHRYRMEYKTLQKFRSLFYEKVENTPSFEKYVEFYKWLDSSVGLMLQQLIPASGNFSESMRNMIENHILERNKYWTKFPTLEMKQDPPEGTLRGIRELTYDWEHGHAPADRYNKKSISLDGTNDYILLTDDNAFSFTDGADDKPFSISAWVYVGDISADNGPFVAKVNFGAANSSEYLFKHENGKLMFHIYDSDLSTSGQQIRAMATSASLSSKTWHHVVATYDGSKAHAGLKVYTDGVATTAPTSGTGTYVKMRNTTAPLAFGATIDGAAGSIANRVFEDKLADIALFDKVLSADEIKELYNGGEVYNIKLHSASSNIIAWWKMGDGDTAPTIQDSVGTRHGTLSNGASIIGEFELPSVLDYDEYEHCLWRAERAERTSVDATENDNVDKDREKIRKAVVRDVLGKNKMVPVGTDGFVEQGDPTLYDIVTAKQYEGSTYATRRLSRPYRLNLDKARSVKGGPNFADATLASPNDLLRAATNLGTKISLTRLADDPDECRDEYAIKSGPETKKRRSHVVTITDVASVATEVKGSLFTPPFYGAHPNDAAATQRNVTHDSYGQDHEVPMQGVFAAEWVGGNQHRHIDLNKGIEGAHDSLTSRPELYRDNGSGLVHPHDINEDHPAARYTRDGMAKRPFNIANINTGVNEDNYTTYLSDGGTPKLGNYTRDYEIIQTSGRSVNNRWLVKNPTATPNSIASTYITGLYDYTLPDRSKDSSGSSFGRTEHVFVERFSAPGSAATLSRGSLDYQAGEFSPYNSMNYRNLRVRHHLNFWQKEHAAQFGYREDYIHGTPTDGIGGTSNDFGGNTANVGAWHKNNRNPLTRMHLQVGSIQQPFCLDPSYTTETGCTGDSSIWTTPTATIESRRRYDNFYVSHQIPQSDWQYHWITSSAVHFANINEYDDERRESYSTTTFPYDHDGDGDVADKMIRHPRLSGYVSNYANLTIGVSGSMDHLLNGAGVGQEVAAPGLLTSGSFSLTSHDGAGTETNTVLDIDFVYGNYIFVDAVDWANNLLGTSCPDCGPLVRRTTELGFSKGPSTGYAELNGILLNRGGPYQGASWKMLKNAENPIVRQQRRRNIITIQAPPAGNKSYEIEKPAERGSVRIIVKAVPSNDFSVSCSSPSVPATVISVAGAGSTNELATLIAKEINGTQTYDDPTRLIARSPAGSSIVNILTSLTGKNINNNTFTITIKTADYSPAKKIYFSDPTVSDSSQGAKTVTETTSGLNKIVAANFDGASDASISVLKYNDRRSDTHEKYIEPPATWNMPIKTVVSERDDSTGTLIVHSYSNNLEAFANPNLTYRTDFVKEDKQFHDHLFKKYDTNRSPNPELDFVGLRYKEYIFPKHRNVGLLKIRGRVKWNDIDAGLLQNACTGDLRVFWRDNVFDRMKGGAGASNALGYNTESLYSYLMGDEQWNNHKSIFAMDNVAFQTTSGATYRLLGDLQYVGAPTYLSWIVNRACKTANSGWESEEYINKVLQASLVSAAGGVTPIGGINPDNLLQGMSRGQQVVTPAGTAAVSNAAAQAGDSQMVSGDAVATSFGAGQATPYNTGAASLPQASAGGARTKALRVMYGTEETMSRAVKVAYGKVSEQVMEFSVAGKAGKADASKYSDLQAGNAADASLDNITADDIGWNEEAANAATTLATQALINIASLEQNPRCISPEPVVQLYYNPWSENTYKEEAWLYRTNQISGKNPWYDRYVDFSIETRAMAQNYGLMAEFCVTEHMDKYILDASGDFRAKNYNFLTLRGASYYTEAPHAAIIPTEDSGKMTVPTQQVYSRDGSMDKIVSEFTHVNDKYSMWQGFGQPDSADAGAIDKLKRWVYMQNIAYSHEESMGTWGNSATPYNEYFLRNPIYAGGEMKISNSVAVDNLLDVKAATPWTGHSSWADATVDSTQTGRHRYFAQGDDLDDADELYDPKYQTEVYREAGSFDTWKPVTPYSHGSVTSLGFNLGGGTDEYMVGEINYWDKYTASGPKDTKIYDLNPFDFLTVQTHSDNYRSEDGTNRTRYEYRTGTPVTISIWAKPEANNKCTSDNYYDGKPIGLYVFGRYTTQESGIRDVNKKTSKAWRRDIVSADGNFGLFANYPAPRGLESKFPDGMGVTFFTQNNGPQNGNVYKKAGSVPANEEGIENENIYHFFFKDTTTGKFHPAVLNPQTFTNVILQILPPQGTAAIPTKIKLTMSSPSWLTKNEETLYGIHRRALTNTTFQKKLYQACPIFGGISGNPFGADYGGSYQSARQNLNIKDYKIGKSIFPDKEDDEALGIRRTEYYHFRGQLAEFSMWSGILSKADLYWWRKTPKNILGGLINGEIIGGYTSDTLLQKEWGSTASTGILVLPAPYDASDAITYTQSVASAQTGFLEATRSTCKLAVWHRLGVKPTVNLLAACEDWDDEFFNSYVHTDTIQFFDALVEDHDAVSDTTTKRLRFKVNALKKLIPYRGFYPQDRTLQLAKLFKEKMIDSITGPDASILHEEQAMQAALQPFFAPGILYNSIKAGVAVDWPAFTNETGLEPTYPNSEITLPHYNEDIKGLESGTEMDKNGPSVPASSIVPNWYSPRDNPTSAIEGLWLEAESVENPEDVDMWESYHTAKIAELVNVQPKFTLDSSDVQTNASRADSKIRKTKKNGYVILTEPNTRIPFEGLVALDSVLPSAADALTESETSIVDKSFMHMDLEISGWDSEGVEITFRQPEPKVGYNNPNNYPAGDDIAGEWEFKYPSVSIGDPDRLSGAGWDVEVDFQTSPIGFLIPSFDGDGQSITYEDNRELFGAREGSLREPVSIDRMNEEIAVNLCREINRRQDIHFVAIPGYTPNYKWAGDFAGPTSHIAGFDAEQNYNDDHVARAFPAVYPEACGINPDDFKPELTYRENDDGTISTIALPQDNEGAWSASLWSTTATNPEIWSSGHAKKPPLIGKQNNGTWRIRLIYVGPPQLELDMNLIAEHDCILWKAANHGFDADDTSINLEKISKRPYDGLTIDGEEHDYDPANRLHYNVDAASDHGFFNGRMVVGNRDGVAGSEGAIDDLQRNDDGTSWLVGGELFGGMRDVGGWKAMHLLNPYRIICSDDDGSTMFLYPAYWIRNSGTDPHSFFTGGNQRAFENMGFSLGEVCSVGVTRHLGTLTQCRWIDGWGWFGSAKYSIDTELGVRCVSSAGLTLKGNFYDGTRNDVVFGLTHGADGLHASDAGGFLNEEAALRGDSTLGVSDVDGRVASLEESVKPQQGPFGLYGGIDNTITESIRITPKPHQMYLMVPEYYMGHGDLGDGGPDNNQWAANWKNYCYPYFEYMGSNGDPRFEMAMHNFLAEVPNFFLQDSKLISFSSKPESQFKTMMAGKTYSMDVTMYQSEGFCMVSSPHSHPESLGRPRKTAFNSEEGNRLTMEGRYFGPAFRWKDTDNYVSSTPIERQLIRDPAQAPYVPPYMYGKAIARISFTPSETRKYSLEEIFAGINVDNESMEQQRRFVKCAEEDMADHAGEPNIAGIFSSPAYKARTTISASMNLFGKTQTKVIQYSAQLGNLRNPTDESQQQYVPQTATDPSGTENDVWVIGTKFESPILNFYNQESLGSMASPGRTLPDGTEVPSTIPAFSASENTSSALDYLISTTESPSGAGIWSGYGAIPSSEEGVFVTIEETNKLRRTYAMPRNENAGSLIDVCGFEASKQKVGEIASEKEISEAVVMIPFVDSPSETAAETIMIDGRNFFKIDKDLFNLQKNNIDNGRDAVQAGEWLGVQQNIPETSITKMIKGMKKFNLPPKYDFVRYPMIKSQSPFVMYIFEFNHVLDKQDLSDIWQGLPPTIALSAQHDSATILHDLSPVDFFEENTLPRNVRWMTFKVKKRAKQNYFQSTATGTGDSRFEFNFELGKMAPKYSYNWPYDFFTMLEMVQIEAGVDIYENKETRVPQVRSSQSETSEAETRRQISQVKQESLQGSGRMSSNRNTFGSGEDR